MSTEIINITLKLSLQNQVPQTVNKMFLSVWVLFLSMSLTSFSSILDSTHSAAVHDLSLSGLFHSVKCPQGPSLLS